MRLLLLIAHINALLIAHINGQYTPIYTSESLCPAGTTSASGNGVIGECISCAPGSVQPIAGQTNCTNCKFGRKANADFTSCVNCTSAETECPGPYSLTITSVSTYLKIERSTAAFYRISTLGFFSTLQCTIGTSVVTAVEHDNTDGTFMIFVADPSLFQAGDRVTFACPLCLNKTAVSKKNMGPGCFASFVPKETSSDGCFPATAKILVYIEGMPVSLSMKNLKIGEMVFTPESSPIFFFSHRDENAQSSFIFLQSNRSSILLSPDHLIFIDGRFIQAKMVKIGSMAMDAAGNLMQITATSTEWAKGLYNPHSMTGELIVDNFRVSCYTNAIRHEFAHALLAPLRAMYDMGLSVV